MKNILSLTHTLLAFIFLQSCEDVIEVQVPESPPRLVVEGSITNVEGQSQVRLSWSTPYFDASVPPPVTDAQVQLLDQSGDSSLLIQTEPGLYVKGSPGIVGHTYTLRIHLADGQVFRSKPETLRPISSIEHIRIVPSESDANPNADSSMDYIILLTSIEPQDEVNFYRWKVYINDTLQNEPEDLAFARDDFVNEQVNDVEIYEDEMRIGDVVCVEQMSISENYYDFLNLLLQQTAFTGGLFDPPPAPIKGNVFDEANPSTYALGYFNASALDKACRKIK